MNELVGAAVVAVGIAFEVVGCIGLVRMPDVYNRLQAGTKCVTAGTCVVLLGVAVALGTLSGAVKCLICIAFVLLTSPTAAHALARAAHRSGIPLWEGSTVDRYRDDRQAETRRPSP